MSPLAVYAILVPYTTLFRSRAVRAVEDRQRRAARDADRQAAAVDLNARDPPAAQDVAQHAFTQPAAPRPRSEEHTSELQSQSNLVCRPLPEIKTDESRPYLT